MRRAAAFLLPLLAAALAGCTGARVRTHPDFADRSRGIASAAVLPSAAYLMRVDASGKRRPRREDSRKAAEELGPLIVGQAGGRGFEVRLEQVEGRARTADLLELYSRFNHALNETYAHRPDSRVRSDPEDYRISLGEPARRLAADAEADALLLASLWGSQESAGKVIKRWGAAVVKTAATLGHIWFFPGASSHLVLDVALIDGSTGDILWLNRRTGSWSLLRTSLGDLVEEVFSDYPVGRERRDR